VSRAPDGSDKTDVGSGRGNNHDPESLRVLREEMGLELTPVELPDFPAGALSFILSAEAAAFDELTRSGHNRTPPARRPADPRRRLWRGSDGDSP